MNWTYGITTVPSRKDDLLLKTRDSLVNAGFDKPDRIFVDGYTDATFYQAAFPGSEVTVRSPAIRIFGNWFLGMMELYLRSPRSDRYAMFQDDILLCKNTRQYLEQCEYPSQGYLNLYTMPENRILTDNKQGWHLSNQKGRGGLALVFSHEAIIRMGQRYEYILQHAQGPKGITNEDGVIVTAMAQIGWKEYIHLPSLAQHTGKGKGTMNSRLWPDADSFRGEDFDAMTLVIPSPQA